MFLNITIIFRHIHSNLSMWVITIKNNFLATSMSVMTNFHEDNNREPSIFIHDLQELVKPPVKNEMSSVGKVKESTNIPKPAP